MKLLAGTWNDLVGTDLFRSSVFVEEDGNGRIDVLVDEYEEHRLDGLESSARSFVESLLTSAREAVRATEQCVSGPLRPPCVEHLPLFGTVSEFLDFIDSGALAGLRPDQIQLIEQYQPYYWSNADRYRPPAVRRNSDTSVRPRYDAATQRPASRRILGALRAPRRGSISTRDGHRLTELSGRRTRRFASGRHIPGTARGTAFAPTPTLPLTPFSMLNPGQKTPTTT